MQKQIHCWEAHVNFHDNSGKLLPEIPEQLAGNKTGQGTFSPAIITA